MRRAFSLLGLPAYLLGLACASVATAQDEDPGAGDEQFDRQVQAITPEENQVGEEAAERPQRAHRPRFEPTVSGGGPRHFGRRLERLHEVMKKELSLSGDQEEAIDTLFKEHMRAFGEGPGHRGPNLSPEERAKWKELRDKAVKARKEGDQAAIEQVREELRAAMKGRRPTQVASPDHLVDAIEKELDKSQIPKFRKLVQRFRIGSYADRPTAALRRIAQAARRPDVRLSAEQRRSVVQAIRDAQGQLDKIEDDEKAANEVVEDARAKVLELMSPTQRERFEAALQKVELQDQKRQFLQREGIDEDQRGTENIEGGQESAAPGDAAVPDKPEKPQRQTDDGGG